MKPPKEDIEIGLMKYVTTSYPVYGEIKKELGDFIVEEIVEKEFKKNLKEKKQDDFIYPVYEIERTGLDTFSCINILSKKNRIAISNFRTLGLKDKKTKATQLVFLKSGLLKNNSNILVSLLGWSNHLPTRRVLVGNRFDIKIKNIKSNDVINNSILSKSFIEFDLHRLPNYYGHQRFGIRRINHLIGKSIVREHFEQGILLYLTHISDYENDEITSWRKELYNNQNYDQALKDIPPQLRYEKQILLSKDLKKAYKIFSLKLRRFFINSYQSYLYNLLISKRIEKGLSLNRPEYGDYVKTIKNGDIRKVINKTDDIDSRILIPIFGYGYRESVGEQGKIEKELLREENLDPKSFYIKTSPELSCRSTFRSSNLKICNLKINEGNTDINLSFSLEKGSYATMFLREILKPETPSSQGF